MPQIILTALCKFIEKVNVNGLKVWTAATEAFGRDIDFLQFHSLALAFRDEKGMLIS